MLGWWCIDIVFANWAPRGAGEIVVLVSAHGGFDRLSHRGFAKLAMGRGCVRQ